MAEGIFIKHFDSLRAGDEMAESIMSTIKSGEAVRVKVTRSRSLPHFRLYWKLMSVTFENQTHDIFATKEDMEEEFRIAIGHFKEVPRLNGTARIVPLPINFNQMDQAEFNIFFDKAVDFVCTRIIPGMVADDLRREVHDLLG
jgi:hypothetical protein